MASIDSLKASDGTGAASVATVQSVRAPAATTLVVDTVQGINGKFHATMGTPHTFVDPVTSETITVISESTAVDFQGHVDGGNLEIDVIAPGFTDAGSAVNDIVIIKPTTQWADEVADVLEVQHNDDGTHKSLTTDTLTVSSSVTLPAGSLETADYADGSVTDSKWRNGVAFSAYRSSALNVGAANVDIVFDTENYDYGSDYDNSTGVFTAPYDGIYSFVVTMDGTAAATTRMFIQPVTTGTTTIVNQRPLDINATRTYLVQAVFEGRMNQNATIKFQGFSVSTVNVAGTMTNVSGHLVTRV